MSQKLEKLTQHIPRGTLIPPNKVIPDKKKENDKKKARKKCENED